MAEPYATVDQARGAYAGENANIDRLNAVMRTAASKVQRLAPVPSPEPWDYFDLAVAGELIYGEWLWKTGGFVSSESLLGASRSYGTSKEIEDAIADVMGDYAETGVGVAYLDSWLTPDV